MLVDNQVAGTYVHGLFGSPEASTAWLKWAGLAPWRVILGLLLRELIEQLTL